MFFHTRAIFNQCYLKFPCQKMLAMGSIIDDDSDDDDDNDNDNDNDNNNNNNNNNNYNNNNII